ncbi:hypothetical protein LR021_04460, partial [Candidatus Bipolaricaulota bacterium]|nr:hypothetical protein [Candidatus Bipolaricaulota bacterium]
LARERKMDFSQRRRVAKNDKKGMTGNKNELILLGVLARERKLIYLACPAQLLCKAWSARNL